MNKGFVFMTEDYSIFHLALERGVLGQQDRCAVLLASASEHLSKTPPGDIPLEISASGRGRHEVCPRKSTCDLHR